MARRGPSAGRTQGGCCVTRMGKIATRSTRRRMNLVYPSLVLLALLNRHSPVAKAFSSTPTNLPPSGLGGVNPNVGINPIDQTTVEPSNKATQIMQGTGMPLVDMNQYNIYDNKTKDAAATSLEAIAQEWTACLKQKVNEQRKVATLGVRSDRLFADTVQVRLAERTPEKPGLGIELVELKSAGGKEIAASEAGTLGITVVADLVSGGASDGLDILPGDSIVKVALVRRKLERGDTSQDKGEAASLASISDQVETMEVITECLDYDSTVAAIGDTFPTPIGLPQSSTTSEYFIVTLKRIRRKPRVKVKLQYPPDQGEKDDEIELLAGENLRMGMLKRGVKLNDPLAQRFDTKTGGNCGAGGLCRTCAVSILRDGNGVLNPQRAAEQQMLADTPRWRLACKAIVGYGMKEGELSIRVNPRQF